MSGRSPIQKLKAFLRRRTPSPEPEQPFEFPPFLDVRVGVGRDRQRVRVYNAHAVAERFGFEGKDSINHAIGRIEGRYKTTLKKVLEGTPEAQTLKESDGAAVYVTKAGGSRGRG